MLSDIEITYFRSRIDDVLQSGRPTDWQRSFLVDMRGKIERYGTRTRLSEKQLATLKRLTAVKGDADLRLITNTEYVQPQQPQRLTWQKPRRRRPLRYREIKFTVFAVMMIVCGVGYAVTEGLRIFGLGNFETASAASSQFQNSDFSVTDGDTIRMRDGTPVRLVGYNTPEKFEPRCSREAALGNQASERLRQLVAAGKSTVTRIACSCKPGTEGTSKCNYGRSCGYLRVDGRDVGQTLISEGLAVPFICGATGCPPTPRPWCG
ncbi:thermonuclease family protein [Rhizobium leguminosarum]|uniref:thermonuclease family protein n=1 Tax=Rhizobium leguminosarum TaxID=384 RepID=UPI0013B647EC|nr:thermonuclease family protein [Rhizobium leguminosarum]NEI64969.1 thermonuclease family protein [Rhizobium leguminosarum]